jgi:putative ABC transport system permease protein
MLRHSTARTSTEKPRSRLAVKDLFSEAMAGILQRPARTILTMLGTVIGVGAFNAILGLTATAQGQISTDFTVLGATQMTVKDIGDASEQTEPTMYDFPRDADSTIGNLNGVVHAGVRWQVFSSTPNVSAPDVPEVAQQTPLTVYAASPGYLRATDPTLAQGVLINEFDDTRRLRVAVLGQAAANQLGITNLTAQPAIFIDGVGYTVIGILGDEKRDPENLLSVLIPDQTALENYGFPSSQDPAQMLIETKLGAAKLIARQAATALRPDQPALLQAIAPPDPHTLQNTVNGNLDSLFLLLAALTLVIGTVGIANTTLVAVMERVGEIGLRRSLGARPRHIATQFLCETTLLGTVGGFIGTALGIAVTLAVAIDNHWTALLNPATTLPAPLIGTLTGLLAGAYPSLRAAKIQPLEALRR